MTWHIFRKDWALLWPLVTLIAALQFANAAIWLKVSPFGGPPGQLQMGLLTTAMVFLGIAVLIVTTVHRDAIPGVRQDWLIRPIRRRDLFLAKLLFVLIAVHVPMLLANLGQALATGFDFWDALSAALSRCIYLLVALSLPMFAVAVMTATLVEFVASMLAIGLISFVILLMTPALFPDAASVRSSGMDWLPGMWGGLWLAVVLAAAIVIIPLQYFRRATVRARGIAIGAVLLAQSGMFIPWAPAFSFQQLLSADPAAAKPIAVAFDPGVGKFAMEPGRPRRPNAVWLPLRVSGLAAESIVITDRADVRIIGRDGAIMFRRIGREPPTTNEPGLSPDFDNFPVRTVAAGDVRTHQRITLPRRLYEHARTQLVRIELDYSLTLFRIEAADKIAALNGNKRLAIFGWCKTRIDDDSGQVQLGCLTTGGAPTCVTAMLENPLNGQHNPASNVCRPDYWPFAAHVPYDLFTFIDRTGRKLGFRDPQGLAKYPVDSAQIANAQVILKSYRPVAHFRRHLVIPAIRLGDWEVAAGETAANTTQQ